MNDSKHTHAHSTRAHATLLSPFNQSLVDQAAAKLWGREGKETEPTRPIVAPSLPPLPLPHTHYSRPGTACRNRSCRPPPRSQTRGRPTVRRAAAARPRRRRRRSARGVRPPFAEAGGSEDQVADGAAAHTRSALGNTEKGKLGTGCVQFAADNRTKTRERPSPVAGVVWASALCFFVAAPPSLTLWRRPPTLCRPGSRGGLAGRR